MNTNMNTSIILVRQLLVLLSSGLFINLCSSSIKVQEKMPMHAEIINLLPLWLNLKYASYNFFPILMKNYEI